MKKQVMVEKTFCDCCGKEASGYEKCFICSKEFCYDCKKIDAIEYKHGVYFSGSGDGLYRKVMSLRLEAKGFTADFDKRVKNAEDELKRESDVERGES